jgi:Mg-chelatase subunit ChlD
VAEGWLAERFAEPGWLWLLALIPPLVALRLRRGPEQGRVRLVLGCVLRAGAVASLAVALAGPLAGRFSRHTDLVFALDRSRSVGPEASAQAVDFVNRALAAKPPDARVGMVVFGADAQVEVPLTRDPGPLGGIAAAISTEATDIGRALEVALGALPSQEHRRVVLLSDGRENRGDALAAADVARSLGVEVLALPLERPPGTGEVSVRGVDAPARVRVHEPFRLQVLLHAARPTRAQLLVLRDGVVLQDVELDLAGGLNAHRLVDEAQRSGLHAYEAVVNAPLDGAPENNRYTGFVQVDGPPRVLHVVGRAGDGRWVSAALAAQGLVVQEVPGDAVPGSLHALGGYDLVILNNVSGFDMSLAKMEQLEAYVRDVGGGIVMLGGDRSYAAGGYLDTPVERLLPVTMDVQTEVRIPTLAVVFVLDRSGSMGSRSQGEEKLVIARNAALGAIELLNRLDRVGVLAFDDAQEWIVPPTEVGNRRPIAQRLRSVGAGGSTDLVRALMEAHRVLREQQAKVKHLIVLSDGLAGNDVRLDDFAAAIDADGITVSTVALGADANRTLMAEIATLGKGRFYYTADPRNVPRIFTSETLVVSRNLMVEEDTPPLVAHPGEMLDGLLSRGLPLFAGYQRAFEKPAAQVLLRAAGGDPLLASWRYGLGKSVAFTSDLTGRWGREWVRWRDFGRFVAQMARWTMRRRGDEHLQAAFRWEGGRGRVQVDVLDAEERFVNGLDLAGAVVRPGRDPVAVVLEQVAPGRYEGEFQVDGPGSYYVTLTGSGAGVEVGPRTFGVAVPYSSEYLDQGADRKLLAAVAGAAGGRMLPLAQASLPAVLAPKPRAEAERWRVWWPWLLAALVLVVLEVAVRKVLVPDTRGARAVAGEPPGPRVPASSPRAARSRDASGQRARLHVALGAGRRR